MSIVPFGSGDANDFNRVKNMVTKANYYMPHMPDGFCRILHSFGALCIQDDRADIGHFSYMGRETHYYFGRKSPNHKSPWHHWQGGAIMVFLGMLGSLLSQFGQALMEMTGLVNEIDTMEEPQLDEVIQKEMMVYGTNDYERVLDEEFNRSEFGDVQSPEPDYGPNVVKVDPRSMLTEIPPKKEIVLPQLPF